MVEHSERSKTATVGKVAAQLAGNLTLVTECNPSWPVASRLDDQQIDLLRQTANMPLPILQPCDPLFLDECLLAMTTLPRRADDRLIGSLRVEVYTGALAKFDRTAIKFLRNTALTTCRFFPSPAECLKILEGFDSPVARARRERDAAQARIRREMTERFRDWQRQLRRGELTQADVDAAPERWRMIAETAGDLRKDADGHFVLRAVGAAA